jgi:hypothetical protein
MNLDNKSEYVNQARLKKGYFFLAAFFAGLAAFFAGAFFAAFLAGMMSLLSLVDSLTTR